MKTNRRGFLGVLAGSGVAAAAAPSVESPTTTPNAVRATPLKIPEYKEGLIITLPDRYIRVGPLSGCVQVTGNGRENF